MNWLKKKAFGWAVKFLKNKIMAASPEIGEIYFNAYAMSTSEFLTYLTNKIAVMDLKTISFPSYLKKIDDPMKDDIEEWIDAFIDGMDPRS